MELIINTESWYENRLRAQELGDESLNRCLTQVINFAMPPVWSLGELKKHDEYLSKLRCRLSLLAGSMHVDKPDRRDILDRIDNLWKRLDEKWIKVHNELWDTSTGGNKRIIISKMTDIQNSFCFSIFYRNGQRYMNGAIVFNKDHWEIHT